MRLLIMGNSGSGKSYHARWNFLLAWVAGYYERDDAMSYACHRRLFDAFKGNKTEVTTRA